MAKFYAVKKGKKPGIYNTWDECKAQVTGYSGAVYKSFKTKREALDFVSGKNSESIINSNVPSEKNLQDNEAIYYIDGSYFDKHKTFSTGICKLTKSSYDESKRKYNSKEWLEMRNVSGELFGVILALKDAKHKKYNKIFICYDYAGIEKWANNEWKANKTQTQAYKEAYKELSKNISVNFVKIKSHTGVKYNEVADQLAKDALDNEKFHEPEIFLK